MFIEKMNRQIFGCDLRRRLCVKIDYIKQYDQKNDIQNADEDVCHCESPKFLGLPPAKYLKYILQNLSQIPDLTIKLPIPSRITNTSDWIFRCQNE